MRSPTTEDTAPLRIVLLTYESLQSRVIVRAVLDAFPHDVVGVLASEVTIVGKRGWGAAWFVLRRTGLGFVGMKALEIWLSRIAAWRNRAPSSTNTVPSLAEMTADAGIPLVGVADVNGAEAQACLADWRPDLLISANLNQLLALRTMARARLGAVNVHGALLPRYRGLFPYFWVLANGEPESGVTVHWMDERFDTGPVILQEPIPIAADETVFSLSMKGAAVGARLLVRAIGMIADGSATAVPQPSGSGNYCSWPTPADVRRLRRRGRRYGSLREMWRALRA